MTKFIVLMRGINVGGKNKIAMAELRRRLEQQGFEAVETYIQSGNVVLRSDLDAAALGPAVETLLSQSFELDTSLIKTLVLKVEQLQAVVDEKPAGFGEQPDTYHSDVIFLMGIDPTEALPAFDPREGVDQIWPGHGVIYSQRLSALRTRSRLSRIAGFPAYKSMTIRSWSTTTKLLSLAQRDDRA